MIKKFISFALAFLILTAPAYGAWDKNKPAGSDLISDIDTLVVANNTALELTASGLQGWLNLKVVRTSATQVTVTADQLYLKASATLAMRATSVSEVIDITASGASGLDTGAEGNVWYYIWIIAKADGTVNGLLSASSTSPTLPAGYIYYSLVSAVHNTAGDFVDFIQEGRKYFYSVWPSIASGSTASTSVDTTAYIPSGISSVGFGTVTETTSSEYAYVSNVSPAVSNPVVANQIGGTPEGGGEHFWMMNLITANTLYYIGNAATSAVFLAGFELNKLS